MQLNRTRMLGLGLTSALILAACGGAPQPAPILQGGPSQQNPNPSNPGPNPGTNPGTPAPEECATVTIDLQGVAAANITVLQNGTVYKSMQVADNDKIKLPAGTFQIRGEAQNGFSAPNTPASVTLDCGGAATATAVLAYRTATATQIAGISADLNRNGDATDDKAFTDELNAAFDYQREINPNKDALLLASQTEEPINITMVARDAAGNPVPGAVVTVTADSDSVSIFPGHAGAGASAASASGGVRAMAMNNQPIIADGNGIVRFHVYAVSSVQTGAPPVRFVVNASGGAGSTTSSNAEFKVFFYNISHLLLGASTNGGAEQVLPTDQRVGKVFGSPFDLNFFNPTTARPDVNSFRTLVQPKQPTGPAVPVGGTLAPGRVAYDIVSTGDGDDGNLELVTNPDGSVSVRPVSGLEQSAFKNGPLDVRVRARYYAQVTFGPSTYEFLLKSYEFDVDYSTPILEVDKTGPQVITWSGYGIDRNGDGDFDDVGDQDPWDPNDVTAPQELVSGMKVGRQYTYDVVVRNTGATTAKNVTARDVLPAELGFVSATVVGRQGARAEYDDLTHAIEVNNIGDLAQNQSVTVRLTVYPRHKPGYAWNDNNRDGNTDVARGDVGGTGYWGERPPVFNETATGAFVGNTEYADPYMVKNFAKANATNGAEARDTLEINVVRPMMQLDKTALDSSILTNNTATYAISVRNIDRATSEEANPIVRAGYADLKSRYPNQYAAEGTFFYPVVVDAFGSGLANPSFYSMTATGARSELDRIRFDRGTFGIRLPDIALGETRTFYADLRAETVGNGGPERRNCVYLYGWNLNQPGQVLTGPVISALPGRPGPFPALAPQYETFDPETGESIPQAPATSPVFDGRNYLADCEDINIFREDISFDSKLYDSEASNGNDAVVTPFQQIAEELFNNRLTDTFRVGDNFEYNFRQLNEGTSAARDVVITLKLPSMASIATLRDWQLVFGHNVLGTAGVSIFSTVNYEDVIAGGSSVNLGGGKTASITRSADGHTITIKVNQMDSGDFVLGNIVMNAVTTGSGKLSMGLSYYTVNPGSTTTATEEELTRVVPRD
ncbi:DUF11 domain-containing protein [Deinococcus pimensis]|uniref:DUF11 domain-containing protein n=1 Tax=Deinococcus pimensis TaxID=309888 RepID=UPI0012F78A14|nr:DUF11 domain-containing protein [Deinococcus pimensis]